MSTSSTQPARRALSLDALRGFAILTMVLSGVIPYNTLPAWMYHAQLPPPTHKFVPELAGLTWVDLVFPLFLFALGAAIPLALGKRLEKGDSYPKIIFQIIQRTFLLGFFAIFLQHVRPHQINNPPDVFAWLIALLGFTLMFPLFMRFPATISKKIRNLSKILSWVTVLLIFYFLRYKDGSGFSLNRSDIIIIVLTNGYFFGSLFWLLTRNNLLWRLAILAILLGLRISHSEPGWTAWFWDFSPLPWIYKLYYLQYLFIVIPGTIVGDLIIDWIKKSGGAPTVPEIDKRRYICIGFLMILIIIIQLIGLQSRLVWQTFLASLILIITGYYLMPKSSMTHDRFIYKIFNWAVFLLILGHVFESFEGGIKKDPSTLSYYLITVSLSIFVLILFFTICEVFGKQKYIQLLIDSGQNPMIAYVGFANLIWPVLALTGLDSVINHGTANPWLGFIRGLVYTILLAYIVQFFTRKRIFWRT